MTARGIVMTLVLPAFLAACGEERAAAPTAPSGPLTGTLSGILTSENGARIPGAVFIIDGPNSPRVRGTNAAGEYLFTELGPGLVTLRVAANGHLTVVTQIFLNGANSASFSLALMPKGVMTGNVSDADTGAAIAGANVLVLPDPTTDARLDFNRAARTDAQGAYRFESITLGNINISVTAAGYEERRTGGNLGRTPALNVQLRRRSG
jgi:hypothetical protein